jgi:hypothetical protein
LIRLGATTANNQISLVVCWSSATNAYNSNFFGQQAGYGATGAYGSNFLVKMLVYSKVLQFKSLDNLLDNLRQMLMLQISWVIKLVIKQQVLITQISLVLCWSSGTSASNSNFLVIMLVVVQHLLIGQISLVKMLVM